MLRYLIIIFIVLGSCLVFYFSWLPNPNIGIKPYFPKWLGEWTNKNGNLRTAVPFVFLGILLEFGFVDLKEVWKKRFIILIILVGIVIVAELGQLFLPKRHFDIEDILWGISGSILGICTGNIVKRILNR